MNLENFNVLVLGLGKTGYATAKALAKRGASVLVSEPSGSQRTHAGKELEQLGVRIEYGEQTAGLVDDIDLLIPSPGIPNSNPAIIAALQKGIEVISEIELAYRLDPEMRLIGITGTNGKTSVTTLVAEMLNESGMKAVSAGNIGDPLIDYAGNHEKGTIFVVELSSFQLENTRHFRPWIATILNIAEDHIDWHGSLENYAASKWKLFANQSSSDYAVINIDDAICTRTMPEIGSTKIIFSTTDPSADYYFNDKNIMSEKQRFSLAGSTLFGAHNIQNLVAATAIASLAGATAQSIESVIDRFKGLDHRITEVAAVNEVTYYNDSKATNPHAAISAINAFEGKPLVLLMGGKNKGNDFTELAQTAASRARITLLFGESAADIAASFPENYKPVIFDTMLEAVNEAMNLSRSGDNVLLTPACASFDEFNDYKHRGNVFKEAVIEKSKAC